MQAGRILGSLSINSATHQAKNVFSYTPSHNPSPEHFKSSLLLSMMDTTQLWNQFEAYKTAFGNCHMDHDIQTYPMMDEFPKKNTPIVSDEKKKKSHSSTVLYPIWRKQTSS
jgi:hypothetical protein